MSYYTDHMPKRYRRYHCSVQLASSHGHYICRWETPTGRVYTAICTDGELYDAYLRQIKEGKLTLSTVERIKGYARGL